MKVKLFSLKNGDRFIYKEGLPVFVVSKLFRQMVPIRGVVWHMQAIEENAKTQHYFISDCEVEKV